VPTNYSPSTPVEPSWPLSLFFSSSSFVFPPPTSSLISSLFHSSGLVEEAVFPDIRFGFLALWNSYQPITPHHLHLLLPSPLSPLIKSILTRFGSQLTLKVPGKPMMGKIAKIERLVVANQVIFGEIQWNRTLEEILPRKEKTGIKRTITQKELRKKE
jgi:hypothetical protein